jgi:hypothetical protein
MKLTKPLLLLVFSNDKTEIKVKNKTTSKLASELQYGKSLMGGSCEVKLKDRQQWI